MRKAAYTSFGRTLIPCLGAFPDLFYALGLNEPGCVGEQQTLDAGQPPPEPPAATLASDAIYVSPSSQAGPQGDGSLDAPMRILQLAADAAARTVGKTVVLRGGKHYLREPLRLEPLHSGLSLLGLPGESAVLSGGVRLRNLDWQPHDVTKPDRTKNPGQTKTAGQTKKPAAGAPSYPPNIWVAEIGDQVSSVPGLQMDGARLTRARFPNLPGCEQVSAGYGGGIPGTRAL